MRDRHCGTLRAADVGQRLAVCGWVAKRREHGEHLAFVDLRDHTGLIQCVIDGSVEVRGEYVLRVTGTVTSRPDGTVNPHLGTGEVELADCEVEVLATAETPPLSIGGRVESDEQVRLKWRFLDLRRPEANLIFRIQTTF